jgi:cytochrome c oxidase subunit 1
MHFMGLAGMPRRIFDYPDAFAPWNAVSSLGSYISAVSALYFFYVVYLTLTESTPAPNNPWEVKPSLEAPRAFTLEWLLPSPPQFHTFSQLPVIRVTASRS